MPVIDLSCAFSSIRSALGDDERDGVVFSSFSISVGTTPEEDMPLRMWGRGVLLNGNDCTGEIWSNARKGDTETKRDVFWRPISLGQDIDYLVIRSP